ncbi:hypothetical protein GCM10009527_064050 [Actinomadura nitritigenes]
MLMIMPEAGNGVNSFFPAERETRGTGAGRGTSREGGVANCGVRVVDAMTGGAAAWSHARRIRDL